LRWAGILGAGLGLAPAGVIFAQDNDKVIAGFHLWSTSGCSDCHGVFADGMPEDDDYPIGANLRTTRLDGAALQETIRCGRPGKGMPAFDPGSYLIRACNGFPLGAAPDNLQPRPRPLSLEEIDAVIGYLQARIIGRGPITREECMTHYDNLPDCEDYK
jgi:hypothetical protein